MALFYLGQLKLEDGVDSLVFGGLVYLDCSGLAVSQSFT
jgi:hypothetical protein